VQVENSFVVSVLREKCGESPRKGASPPVRRRPDSTARQMVDYNAEEFEPLPGFEGSAPSKSPKAMLLAGEDGGERRVQGLFGGADSEASGGRGEGEGRGEREGETRRSLELERRKREAAEAREAQSKEELKSALRDLDKSRRALSEVCSVPFPCLLSLLSLLLPSSLILPLRLLQSIFQFPPIYRKRLEIRKGFGLGLKVEGPICRKRLGLRKGLGFRV
jgi:hypothetical protein